MLQHQQNLHLRDTLLSYRPSLRYLYFVSARVVSEKFEEYPTVRSVYVSGTPTIEEVDDAVAVSTHPFIYPVPS